MALRVHVNIINQPSLIASNMKCAISEESLTHSFSNAHDSILEENLPITNTNGSVSKLGIDGIASSCVCENRHREVTICGLAPTSII